MEQVTINAYKYDELSDLAKHEAFSHWTRSLRERKNELNTIIAHGLKKILDENGFVTEVSNRADGIPLIVARFTVTNEERENMLNKKIYQERSFFTEGKEEILKAPDGTYFAFSFSLVELGEIDNMYAEAFDVHGKALDIPLLFNNLEERFIDAVEYVLYYRLRSLLYVIKYFTLVCEQNSVLFTENGHPLKDLKSVKLLTYEEFVELKSKEGSENGKN